jgi:glucose-6-phosphate isomerase
MSSTDSLRFLDAVRGLPEQLAAAHEAAAEMHSDRLPDVSDIRNIVVMGMGGSSRRRSMTRSPCRSRC